ncbi:MAG: hypothetical protein HY714_02535 [Candidatus Omnitrophica bacterium]|nr:hypothetical protein [Candidatus Omnitrophota bacterium]
MRALGILLLTAAVSGCAVDQAVYVPYETKLFPARSEASPVLLCDRPSEPYEEMGAIMAYGRWFDGYERVNELLKERAREIGADAVINVRYRPEKVFGLSFIVSLGYSVASAQGVAIRWVQRPVRPEGAAEFFPATPRR